MQCRCVFSIAGQGGHDDLFKWMCFDFICGALYRVVLERCQSLSERRSKKSNRDVSLSFVVCERTPEFKKRAEIRTEDVSAVTCNKDIHSM